MDWKILPYDHSGKWVQKYPSIWNTKGKVTWPQAIAEFVVYWRSKIFKDYPKIVKGKGWSKNIASDVRKLNQQAAVICNYFPHPDDEPLMTIAIKNVFRRSCVLKIGQHRKNRVKKDGKIGITQGEKDIVNKIEIELGILLKKRASIRQAKEKFTKERDKAKRTFSTTKVKRTSKLDKIMEIESKLGESNGKKEK